jgi:hypothetical protein
VLIAGGKDFREDGRSRRLMRRGSPRFPVLE